MSHDPRPVTVVGAGYVGLVTAVGLAAVGRTVDLVETDPDRLAALAAGRAPIFEPGLQEALERTLANGRLRVADTVPAQPAIALVCVGTPIDDEGRADLRHLDTALADIAARAGPQAIVVIRSTMPVGGTRPAVARAGLTTARTFSNPEFLRQGTAIADSAAPSRIVVGRFEDADPRALEVVLGLSDGIDAPRLVVDVEAAEIVKNAANAFLALKLSFVNEIAALCEETGTDVDAVLAGITADPRIGTTYMRPGFGFGGSCLPKELRTLAVAGSDAGLAMYVTTAASDANHAHQARFAGRIADALGGLAGRRIGLLGLAFKAGTDDTRESPALRLARTLLDGGAHVRAFDPAANLNARRDLPNLETVETARDALDGAEAVVIATEWPEFRDLPWSDLRGGMARPLVVDGRRLLDADALRAVGYEVVVLGDGRSAGAGPRSRR